MTIVATPTPAIAVDASKSLEVQALAINAAANQLRTTIAGVWDLANTSAQPPAPEATVFHKRVIPGQESVLEGDERTVVDPQNYHPGGKYRSIVKLLIRYSEKPNVMAHGTGWLIRPDLIATAGHNVYDWANNAGRAIEIKCYVGWQGTSHYNAQPSSVEFHKAARVVTTERWLQTRGSKPHDFALIQVDQPFTNVTPFKYIETPPFEANTRLGVVGYPAETKDENGERGAKMYEMFLDTSYNLEKQVDTMIEYSIDTEGGQSGSPIFLENGLIAIGAHVYGGLLNAGSVLGRYGNPIQDYIAALDVKIAQPDQINLVTIADDVVAAKGAATAKQSAAALTQLEGGEHIGLVSTAAGEPTKKIKFQEGFFVSITDVLKITSRASVLLGPLGEPVRAISLAASQAALLASRAEGSFGEESSFGEELKQTRNLAPSTIRRAELARANVIALTKKTAKANPEGFFDDVGRFIGKAINPIVPALIPGLPFNDAMKIFGIGAQVADRAVGEVAGSLAQAMFLANRLPLAATGKTENVTEDLKADPSDPLFDELVKARERKQGTGAESSFPNIQGEGFFDNVIFAGVVNAFASTGGEEGFFNVITKGPTKTKVSTSIGAQLNLPKTEGFMDPVTQIFTKSTTKPNTVLNAGPALKLPLKTESWFDDVSIDPRRQVGNGLANTFKRGADEITGADNQVAGGVQNLVKPGRAEGWFDDVTDFFPVIKAASWVVGEAANTESSVEEDNAAASPPSFSNNILAIARAFLLRAAIEEQYLVATVAKPIPELKAEGWFDDVDDAVEGAVMWGWERVKASAKERKKDEEGRRPFTPFRIM